MIINSKREMFNVFINHTVQLLFGTFLYILNKKKTVITMMIYIVKLVSLIVH